MIKYTIIFALSLLLVVAIGNRLFTAAESRTYQDTHKLLEAMADVRSDNQELAALIKVGDERISDLIQALDDPAKDISLRAQIVIRYLGNSEGMKRLTEWYSKQDEYPVAGPIPLPLTEWDYKFINLNLIGKSPETWGDRGVQYIYALALDDAPQSKTVLVSMIKSARNVDQGTFIGYALNQVQQVQLERLLPAGNNLPKLVVNHAFFLSHEDHKHASAQLLGLNGTRNMALVEVYVNRGRLAEEWYHVVLKRCDKDWKFFSITPIAIS